MREGGAPGRTRQALCAPCHDRQRGTQQPGALDDVGHRAGDDEQRKPDPERREHRLAFGHEHRRHCDQRDDEGPAQPLSNAQKVAAFPGEQRPERHGDQQRRKQRPEGRVEERRADREIFAPVSASSTIG